MIARVLCTEGYQPATTAENFSRILFSCTSGKIPQRNEERITNQIREAIEAGRDLRIEVEKLDRLHGARAKELIPEALKLKDVGRGFNVLMHAASVGYLPSFTSAVAVVNERVRGQTAVASSINAPVTTNAPLLPKNCFITLVRLHWPVLS